MKNILLNTKYNYVLLLCLATFPVLPKGIQSVLIIVSSIWAFAGNIAAKTRPVLPKTALKPLFALGSLFFLYLISLLYTQDLKTGIGFIVRTLPLAVLPLVFLLRPGILTPNRVYYIKMVYCLAIIALLIKVSFKTYNIIFIDNAIFWQCRKAIETASKVHGTYLCIWCGFAIILLIEGLKKIGSYKNKFIALFVILLMIAFTGFWMFVTGARIAIASFIIAGVIMSLNNIKQLAIVGAVVLCAGAVIALNSEGLGKKITALKEYNFTFPEGTYQLNLDKISSEQIRNGIYYCAYNKIKESWVAGYGIGDVDNELQNCYDTTFTNTDTYKVLKYNSHSQYLQLILSTGVIGFVLYFISYGFLLKKALKSKQTIYFAFLIFMLINFLFENILSRHDGILFFGFFNSVFFFQDKLFLNNEESLS